MFQIKFTDDDGNVVRTFTTTEIKTGKMDRVYELADELKDLKGVTKIREYWRTVKALLVEIFHNQFTFDELQDGVTKSEVERAFYSILRGAGEAVEKNSEGEQG